LASVLPPAQLDTQDVAKAAAAEAKRKSEEAEQQRLAALKAEEQHKRTEAEARARYSALMIQGVTDANSGDYDKAITIFREAIKLDPENGAAFGNRGLAYAKKGDFDQAIADFDEAIRLNPNDARILYQGRRNQKKEGNADIAARRDASLWYVSAAGSHQARSEPALAGLASRRHQSARQQAGAGVG
jgi:tetratricopeptide (TPR) repeat protein